MAADYDAADYDPAQDPDVWALADAIAARMKLAAVQQVPRELLQLLRDGSDSRTQLYGSTPPNDLMLRCVRRDNVLELSFEHYSGRLAMFRFECTP